MTDLPIVEAPYINIGRLTKRDIGQRIDGKGTFLAHEFQYSNPVTGQKTGGHFNVFTTPQDIQFLPNTPLTKAGRIQRNIVAVALLRNICGHDGVMAPTDSYISAFAKAAPHNLSDWHIPTTELVKHMVEAKRKNHLIGTFAEAGDPLRPTRYCTISTSPDHFRLYEVVNIENGLVSYCDENTLRFSCRPVRAEVAPR